MATVIATGEASRERLRSKGVTPGKLDTGSVTRTGRKRTFRNPEGEVTREEEPVTVEGERFTKVTTYSKPPTPLTGTGEEQTPEEQARVIAVQDGQQSRVLTQFEAIGLEATSGGQTRVKPGTFSQETEEVLVKHTPGTTNLVGGRLTGANIGEAQAKITLQQGAEEFNRRLAAEKKAKAGTFEELKAFQKERAEQTKQDILGSKPKYGKFQPLEPGEKATPARILEQAAGITSKGFEYVGRGAEGVITDFQERAEHLGVANVRPPLPIPTITINEAASLTKGVVRGGVTNIGTDKTTATIFLAAAPVGAAVGALRGSQALSFLGKAPAVVKAAGKGIKLGAYTAAGGLVAGSIALSENPLETTGQLAGGALAIGTSFQAGSNLGTAGGIRARQAIETLKAARYKPGTALTTAQGRSVTKFKTRVPTGREVKGVTARAEQTGKATTIKYDLKLGKEQPITKPPGNVVQVDYKAKSTELFRGANKPGNKLPVQQSLLRTDQAGRAFIRIDDFNRMFLNPNKLGGVVIEPGKTGYASVHVFDAKLTGLNIKGYGGAWKPAPRALPTSALPEGGVKAIGVDATEIAAFDSTTGRLLVVQATPGKAPIILTGFTPKPTSITPLSKTFTAATSTTTAAGTTNVFPESTIVNRANVYPPTPASQSIYAAQNIKNDVVVDVNQAAQQVFKPVVVENIAVESQPEYSPLAGTGQTGLTSPGSNNFVGESKVFQNNPISSGEARRVSPLSRFTGRGAIRTSPRTNLYGATLPGLDSLRDTINAERSTSIQDSANIIDTGTISDTTSISDTTADSVTSARTVSPAFASAATTLLTGQPTKPTTPAIPKVTLPGRERRKGLLSRGGYVAFAKVKGKFIAVGQPGTKEQAYRTGKLFVESTPSRTFGVSKGVGAFTGVDFTGKGSLFRKKKGSKGVLFVEPTSKAIDTPGEFKGITLLGIRSSRRGKR